MLKRNIKVLPLLFLMTVPAQAKNTVRVSPAEAATLEFVKSKRVENIKAGEAASVEFDEPAILKVSGRLPILVVPTHDGSEIELSPPTLKSVVNEFSQEEADRVLSTLMTEISEIQSLVRKHQIAEAQTKFNSVKSRFPHVRFLDFIGASLQMVQGKKDEAKASVKRALQAHPDYEEGKKFLKNIEGGKAGRNGEAE